MMEPDWQDIKRRVLAGESVTLPGTEGMAPEQVTEIVQALFPDNELELHVNVPGMASA